MRSEGKIYHKDWMLNDLPDKSVNLILADPPYYKVKGEFDFVWKTFDDYLQDVERWAIECKRVLADNGTLYWYGDAKNIAYAQIIFDKHFNLLNSLVWENTNDHKQQIRFNEGLRSFAPLTERILVYETKNDYHDTIRLAINEVQEYLNTIITRNELADKLLAIGNCRNVESAKQNANNILSQRSAKPQLITEFQYELIDAVKMPYESLVKLYEERRKEFDAKRRPFDNFKNYGDVIRMPNYETGNHEHDTPKPEKLTRELILISSRKNDLILVPFAGSGTECAMAAKENRRFIGFDTELKHVEYANKRCETILAQPQLF